MQCTAQCMVPVHRCNTQLNAQPRYIAAVHSSMHGPGARLQVRAPCVAPLHHCSAPLNAQPRCMAAVHSSMHCPGAHSLVSPGPLLSPVLGPRRSQSSKPPGGALAPASLCRRPGPAAEGSDFPRRAHGAGRVAQPQVGPLGWETAEGLPGTRGRCPGCAAAALRSLCAPSRPAARPSCWRPAAAGPLGVPTARRISSPTARPSRRRSCAGAGRSSGSSSPRSLWSRRKCRGSQG